MMLIVRSLLEAVAFVCVYLVLRDRFDPIQGDIVLFTAIFAPAMFFGFLLNNGISTTRWGKSFDGRIESFVARTTAFLLRRVNARASVIILIILGIGCIAATVFFIVRLR